MQNSINPNTTPIGVPREKLIAMGWPQPIQKILPNPAIRFWIFFLFFFITPYLVMWATSMPRLQKYWFVAGLCIMAFFDSLIRKQSLRELGLRFDTLKQSFLAFGLSAGVLTTLIYFAYLFKLFRSSLQPDYTFGFLAFYFFVSSPGQEFLFRGWLFAKMKTAGITGIWAQTIISALAFSLMHIHHHDFLTFSVSLTLGVIWGAIYHKYPNLLTATLFHSILGVVAVMTRLI